MNRHIIKLMPKRPGKSKQKAPGANDEKVTTAVNIGKDTWQLLREVAFRRAQLNGGRASVSELLRTLVESHRDELEKELKKHES